MPFHPKSSVLIVQDEPERSLILMHMISSMAKSCQISLMVWLAQAGDNPNEGQGSLEHVLCKEDQERLVDEWKRSPLVQGSNCCVSCAEPHFKIPSCN